MAGKRHHHVWQMLQRGFGEKRGKDHHVWVYEKGKQPRQTSTRKHGQEKFFYGPEGSTADQNITDFEGVAQSLVHFARSADEGEMLPNAEVASLVAHLEMRSSFLRMEISRMTERMVAEFDRVFKTDQELEQRLLRTITRSPIWVERQLEEFGLKGEAKELAKAFLATNLEDLGAGLGKDFREEVRKTFGVSREVWLENAKKAQLKTLEVDFASVERTKAYQDFRFTVRDFPSSNLILPDTCLALLKAKGCTPFSQKQDDLRYLVLPVSTSKAIIGRKAGEGHRADATIIRALAGCSFESFLASRNTVATKRLANRIGKYASLLSDLEIRNAVDLSDFLDEVTLSE